MRLPYVCSYCMQEDVNTARPFAIVSFQESNRYEMICPKGHTSVVILQQQKFEVLFEIGAYAIIDGYYREAISSFTSSLERFYEFFIKASLFEKDIDEKIIDESWKHIANQSERQFGAFIFMYTSDFGKLPKLPSDSCVKIRNEVIHKGKIPTKEEAVKYGQSLLETIRPILQEAREKYPKGVEKTIISNLQLNRSQKDDSRPISTMSVPTIISLSVCDPDHHQRSLEEAIQKMYQWQWNNKTNSVELLISKPKSDFD